MKLLQKINTRYSKAQAPTRTPERTKEMEEQWVLIQELATDLACLQFRKVIFDEDRLSIFFDGTLFSHAIFLRIPPQGDCYMIRECVDEEVVSERKVTPSSIRHIVSDMESARNGLMA